MSLDLLLLLADRDAWEHVVFMPMGAQYFGRHVVDCGAQLGSRNGHRKCVGRLGGLYAMMKGRGCAEEFLRTVLSQPVSGEMLYEREFFIRIKYASVHTESGEARAFGRQQIAYLARLF